MFQKARDNSVPLDTIERAVKRGTGELEGVNYESVTYEGYAPSGVALYIETLTDNRNRTGSEVRSILSKNGGSLAEPGAVAWQFARKGVIMLDRSVDEDELMMVALDAGAEDLVDEGDTWRLTCEPTDLNGLRDALEEAGIGFESADLTFLPSQTVPIEEVGSAKVVLNLIDLLDDLDDVDAVHSNFDMPDEILQAAAGG
jgi:YebC/PmpR family DNA-binding regulatory protein